jgi:hypothetical protein
MLLGATTRVNTKRGKKGTSLVSSQKMDPSLSLSSFAITKLASKFSDGISKNKKESHAPSSNSRGNLVMVEEHEKGFKFLQLLLNYF